MQKHLPKWMRLCGHAGECLLCSNTGSHHVDSTTVTVQSWQRDTLTLPKAVIPRRVVGETCRQSLCPIAQTAHVWPTGCCITRGESFFSTKVA